MMSGSPSLMRRLVANYRLFKAFLLAGVTLGIFLLAMFSLTPGPRLAHPQIVPLKPTDSLTKVVLKLRRARAVRSFWLALAYARALGLKRRIKPGVYAFVGNERIDQVFGHLIRGDSLAVTVVIPEGFTVWQIAERLERLGLVCADDFAKAAISGPVVRALHMEPTGAEGYLFPATYYFAPGVGGDEIILTMLARFYRILDRQVEEREFALGINTHQMVTLASIIEKEAKRPEEQPIIASVFYNRMRLGMPLQSDPTAEYDPQFVVRSAHEAVHTASAFNTYDFVGLPPGPIANPGLSAIKAVLYPAQTDYLYFVARSDGSHVFSRSFAEHRRAVAALRAVTSPARLGESSAPLFRGPQSTARHKPKKK